MRAPRETKRSKDWALGHSKLRTYEGKKVFQKGYWQAATSDEGRKKSFMCSQYKCAGSLLVGRVFNRAKRWWEEVWEWTVGYEKQTQSNLFIPNPLSEAHTLKNKNKQNNLFIDSKSCSVARFNRLLSFSLLYNFSLRNCTS